MVKLQTNFGDITIELDADKAPITVANFLAYVESAKAELAQMQELPNNVHEAIFRPNLFPQIGSTIPIWIDRVACSVIVTQIEW